MSEEDEIKELLNDDGELLAVYNDGSTWTFDTLTRQVVEFIDNLQQENKQLKEDKKKAIEYIKNNSYSNIEFNFLTRESHVECHFNNKADPRDLLEILGDKE